MTATNQLDTARKQISLERLLDSLLTAKTGLGVELTVEVMSGTLQVILRSLSNQIAASSSNSSAGIYHFPSLDFPEEEIPFPQPLLIFLWGVDV